MRKLMDLEAMIKTIEATLEITTDDDISASLMLELFALVNIN